MQMKAYPKGEVREEGEFCEILPTAKVPRALHGPNMDRNLAIRGLDPRTQSGASASSAIKATQNYQGSRQLSMNNR